MKYIRLHAHRAIFLVAFFVAIAGLSACGNGSGSSGTGSSLSGSGS